MFDRTLNAPLISLKAFIEKTDFCFKVCNKQEYITIDNYGPKWSNHYRDCIAHFNKKKSLKELDFD